MAISKEEKNTINERTFEEGVKARGAGVWAGAGFGLAYGAAIGAAVGFAPAILLAAPLNLPAIATVTAIFAGIGAATGRLGGSENGSAAGAVSYGTQTVLEEIRGQFKELKKEISVLKAAHGIAEEPSVNTVKNPLTHPESIKGKRTVEWKTLAFALTVGAIFGGLIGVAADGFGWDALTKLLGDVGFKTGAEKVIGSMIAGAAAVGLLGVNVPGITASLSMLGRKINSGKLFQTEKEKALALAQEQEAAQQITMNESMETPAQSSAKIISYQEYVQKQRLENPQLTR